MKLSEYLHKIHEDAEYAQAYAELSLQFELANAILRGRLKKGWSQEDLARAVGTRQANISRIEGGLANPTLNLIGKLVKVLDLRVEFLLPDEKIAMQESSEPVSIPVENWPLAAYSIAYDTRSEASS